jgi:hypothetical protein
MADWVSFKNKLPEEGQRVRVKGHFPFEVNVIFCTTDAGGYSLKVIREGNPIEIYGATEWMPITLPEVADE